MNQNKFSLNQVTRGQMLGLISLAYLFSFAMRLIWVYQMRDNPDFFWEGQLMINTNDGYFFGAGVQKAIFGLHADNPRVFGLWDYGVIFFTTLLTKITPFSLATVTLYMPAIISSLVVIPIILIARLYKQTFLGFLAALLGSITWSYYNRTMTGYYDTDMFSAMAPMVILFFLMKSTMDLELRTALYAGISIIVYPFLYDAGQAIVYTMGIIYGAYVLWKHHSEKIAYASLILIFFALMPIGLAKPLSYLIHIVLLVGLYFLLKQEKIKEQKQLIIMALVVFILFLFLGNVFHLILGKVMGYIATGTKEHGLHFYSVVQTVREAGKIPFETFANRTSGSILGVIISLLGYIVLVWKKPAFILALPLIGIGVFSLWGGLRFTVYAVPIAAMSAIYLFFVLGDFFKERKLKYTFIVFATLAILYPNIKHIVGYSVPTVLNRTEVKDLEKLNKVSSSKDYTLSWWDYGYPIWYYSDTSTLIDGGKHNNDNYIISKIMQTSSSELAANLSRLAIETYVDSNYSVVADTLFKNNKKEQVDPNLLLATLESGEYKLPKKTRDIYIYLPYRMLDIFSTVIVFGNLDLTTGKKEIQREFYPLNATGEKDGIIALGKSVQFDTKKGKIILGGNTRSVKNFIIASITKPDNKIDLKSQFYDIDGEFVVLYMKSYGRFIVVDTETFNSTYVQMFLLGKYDKELFELVVSSPYSRIYKLKK